MKGIGSEITGILSQAEKALSLTGEPRGETGLELALSGSSAIVMHPKALQRTVEENTKSLVSSLRLLNIIVRMDLDSRWKTDPVTGQQTWFTVPVKTTCTLCENASLSEAQKAIEASLAPASDVEISQWLARVNVSTKSQNRSADDFKLLLAVYLDELRKWPGDVVKQVLTNWRDEWFPTLGTLKDELWRAGAPRMIIVKRFKEATNGNG